MCVLGLSGYARSGKTVAANYIKDRFGYERKHIAEPLRAMLAVLLRANGLDDQTIYAYLEGDLKETHVPEFGVTSRKAQILLGTEFGRRMLRDDLWSATWAKGIRPGDRVMNDSVRFPNEEDAIRELGGVTILIVRPGTNPAAYKWGWIGRKLYEWTGLMWGVHDSERTDRLDPDFIVVNDGTLEQLYAQLDRILWSVIPDRILPLAA